MGEKKLSSTDGNCKVKIGKNNKIQNNVINMSTSPNRSGKDNQQSETGGKCAVCLIFRSLIAFKI